MTLTKFIRELQKLEAEGWGRASVAVNKDSLNDGNNTWNICEIQAVESDHIRVVDGDGFGVENKDGSERTRATVVLKGHWSDTPNAPANT